MTPNEELLINVTPREIRVAVIENGLLQELHIERSSRRGVLGNLYKGRVQRVMPGMQAAFVDIGLERAAFLHASDIVSPANQTFAGESVVPETRPQPLITSLVHEGQEIVVQVIKDPIGSKGARLTTEISIPSRYLVLLPDSQVVGISSRIDDDNERQRLKQLVQTHADTTGFGYIVRTNAEGIDAAYIEQDIAYLNRAIAVLRQRAKSHKVGECIYEDLSLPMRAVRDLLHARTATVLIDSHETFDKVQRFAQQLMPGLSDRIQHYSGERPIFDLYGVEDEIGRALDKQVPLKSGGYLVFDQTEAMTSVDINTGSFLGQKNLEETAYRTNLEAAQSVARQLRLRNLGGIIIIDFIDMHDPEHKRQVLRTLEKGLTNDHVKTTVYDFSPLGLVEMTRKRTIESLQRQLCEPCPACSGRGYIKTAETVIYEIFREVTRAVRQFEAERVMVMAAPKVVAKITEEESAAVAELEVFIGKDIRFQPDEQYAQDQFDVVLS
ncbi:ribonuclease G [Arenimonas sp.]|jgi:ribonuclease G|uniref:ribonuclease G n=1 Tax=Arenimonas sp. TaxID=1872635 RepID=UPI0037BF57AC